MTNEQLEKAKKIKEDLDRAKAVKESFGKKEAISRGAWVMENYSSCFYAETHRAVNAIAEAALNMRIQDLEKQFSEL